MEQGSRGRITWGTRAKLEFGRGGSLGCEGTAWEGHGRGKGPGMGLGGDRSLGWCKSLEFNKSLGWRRSLGVDIIRGGAGAWEDQGSVRRQE